MLLNSVKEMAKSKVLIIFILFMLGTTYINSLGLEKLNNSNYNSNEIILNK